MKREIIRGAATALSLIVLGSATIAAPQKGKAKPKPAATAAPKLTTLEFPDGTGSVGLPAGWKIDGSYRGTALCIGPSGERVFLGLSSIIGRPDHPNNNIGIPFNGPMAQDGDLHGAVRAILARNGSQLISLRSRPAPPALQGVPASYLLYEFDSKGKRIVGMGYFSSLVDETQVLGYWELYSSYVIAPKDVFLREFPTMMAVYNSYRPNGKKPREGSDGALIDAAKADGMMRRQQTLKEQQAAYDRMNERFKEVIRQ